MTDADFVFIDLESSGLHEGSYPIEFGWALANADLSSGSFLIKPAPSWTEALWSIQGEIVHGISRDICLTSGIPVRIAARRLNRDFRGKSLFSDNAEFDSYWTARLFEEAGEVQEFEILPVQDLFMEAAAKIKGGYTQAALGLMIVATNATRQIYPHTHRAAPDAIGMAAAYRYIVDPVFRGAIDSQVDALLELELGVFDGVETSHSETAAE